MQKQIYFKKRSPVELAQLCLGTTRLLLQKYRYRISGTRECRQAAHEIAEDFRVGCDSVNEELFTLHPRALWYLGKIIAIIYIIASLCVMLGSGFIYLGTFLCMIGLAYGLSQFVFYGRLFDPIFKSADGCNVVGTLEPTDGVLQQVVLVSHHDSPYIFTFLEHFQSMAFFRFLLGMLFYVWLCVYSLSLLIQQLGSREPQSARGAFLWITIAGLFFVLQLFFMMSSRPSPGAGDNLNSTSMISEIAKYFRDERNSGTPLRHTRLILLSSDGEEIGQRGAREYVKRHYQDLQATQSHVLNIDSIYDYKDLTVLTKDRNFTCKLSNEMGQDIIEVAARKGLNIKRMPIPFGGGGTDAAAFAVAGIEATSIIAQPTGLISNDRLYHTSKDIVEIIDVNAVKATIELAIGYIRKIDEMSLEQKS